MPFRSRTKRAQDAFAKRDTDLSRQVHQSNELAEIASGKKEYLHGLPPFFSATLSTRSPSNLFSMGSLVSTIISTGIAGMLNHPSDGGYGITVCWIVGIVGSNMILFLASWIDEQLRKDFTEFEKARERWEVENYPEGEIQEMICIYNSHGLSDADAELVARTLSKYKEFWVDHMLLHEIGILPTLPTSANTEEEHDEESGSMLTNVILPFVTSVFAYVMSFIPTSVAIITFKSPIPGCITSFVQLSLCLLLQQRTYKWLSFSCCVSIMTTVAISATVALSLVQLAVILVL
jgi:hypothetical protein